MGNQMSVPQKFEDQENESEADSHKVPSESEYDQNRMPVVISTHTVQCYDEVDLGISVKQENGTTSSPKTMEISPVTDASGKNLGKEAKPEAPAAKSRFFLTLSRSVPVRTGDQATDSSTASVKLDVSSNETLGNKDSSESMELPVAAAPRTHPNKTPGLTPAHEESYAAAQGPVSLLPEAEGIVSSKSKDSSFLDKLFKLDKGREKIPSNTQQEARSAEHTTQAGDIPEFSKSCSDAPAETDIVDSKDREGQEITPLSCSLPQDPEEQEFVKEDPQITNTTENSNSIMSFFKTLVSPNKTEAKKDLEDTASKAEIVCDGQVVPKTSDIQTKGTKKKHLHSPRLGLAFRKFFRHKGAEWSPTASGDLKSDKVNFVPQENQGTTKNPISTEPAKEGTKEKGGPTSLPLGKLFWKKSVKEESAPTYAEENVVCESPIEVTKSEEVESALQTVDLNEEEAPPEPTEENPKREERKPPRTSLMAFLRQMSVKGDGGITHSEDLNGKDFNYQTASDSAEKVTASSPPAAEPEPAATVSQKSKEGSSKDKKPVAENNKQKNNKQEAKEPAQVVEPAVVELNSLQNGDKAQKKPEKQKQSLGGFLKSLGPKRMLDAQVQTDPVSIGPVGKSK